MEKILFNDAWRFRKINGKSKGEGDRGSGLPSMEVVIPHDAMLQENRDPKCKNGANTSWFPGGIYEYSKRFLVPKEWQGKSVVLEFEGVYRNAEVYLNNVLVKEHRYGYTGFFVALEEAGEAVQFGAENEIIVRADNSGEPNSRWYTGSGIYRDVWLYVGNRVHIVPDSLRITTVSIHPAVLEIDCGIRGGKEKEHYQLAVEVYDAEGNQAVYQKGTLPVRLEIPNAVLWEEDRPYLYQIHCYLYEKDACRGDKAGAQAADADSMLDRETASCGIRRISWSAQKGLCINDKTVKLRGTCVHHDNGVLGACAFPDAEERKVRKIREAGFNAIRSAHNPCSKAMLTACDKYGVYMMDEAFDQWYLPKTRHDYASDFEECYRSSLMEMVSKDYNHPCVILYSIGNEISETQQERGIKLTKEMVELMHEADETRPVTCGINLFLNGLASKGIGIYSENGDGLASKRDEENPDTEKLSGSAFFNYMMEHMGAVKNLVSGSGFADKATRDAFSYLDICGYNYGSARYEKDGRKYPERIIIGSETFIPDIYENWKKIKARPYLTGDFVWTGWDYLGEAGLGRWGYGGDSGFINHYPKLPACSGAIDITGFVTPEMYELQAAYGILEGPRIGVRPVQHSGEKVTKSPWRSTDAIESWSWTGCEGKRAEVEIYTADKSVRLKLNGKVIGIKKAKRNVARFSLIYTPGVLEAESMDGQGKVTGVARLETASEETVLSVNVEKGEHSRPAGSLIYLDIAVTDANGIVKPLIEAEIYIRVTGAGELAGFGSANPSTEESFLMDSHMTWNGRMLAVIRKNGKGGKTAVEVSSDVTESVMVII